MSLSPNTKKILIISAVVIIVGFLGYYFLVRTSTPVTDLITSSNGEIVGQDILVLVNKLKTISIDSSFLTSALFTNLKDFAVSLVPEPQVRSNPFGSIGGESSVPPPPPPPAIR